MRPLEPPLAAPMSMEAGRCPTPHEVAVRAEVWRVPCGARHCPSCGRLWLGDSRVKVMAAAEAIEGGCALVTVTAPGADVLPWYPGTRLCEATEVEWWNSTAPERWSALHHGAAQAARRRPGGERASWRLHMKVWELQRRGALHLHLVCPFGTPEDRRSTRRYVAYLQRESRRAGFGFVHLSQARDDGRPVRTARARESAAHSVARYVCGYIGSTGAGKPGMAQVARERSVTGAVLYVSHALTKVTGVTIRSLRARRRISSRYAWAGSSSSAWNLACAVDALQRGRPPLEETCVQALAMTVPSWRAVVLVDARSGEYLTPTLAPPPREVCPDWRPGGPRPAPVRVLLDLVLHDDLTACPGGPVRTHVTNLDGLMGGWLRGPPGPSELGERGSC